MVEKLNTPAAAPKQEKFDAAKISELQNKLLGHMRMSAAYSRLADDADAIFDSGLIQILTDRYLCHARDVSKTLIELRKSRGVLD